MEVSHREYVPKDPIRKPQGLAEMPQNYEIREF
jgi:hypothetical protein